MICTNLSNTTELQSYLGSDFCKLTTQTVKVQGNLALCKVNFKRFILVKMNGAINAIFPGNKYWRYYMENFV